MLQHNFFDGQGRTDHTSCIILVATNDCITSQNTFFDASAFHPSDHTALEVSGGRQVAFKTAIPDQRRRTRQLAHQTTVYVIVDIDRLPLEEMTIFNAGVLDVAEQTATIHTVNGDIGIQGAGFYCTVAHPAGKTAAVGLVIFTQYVQPHFILTDLSAYPAVAEFGIDQFACHGTGIYIDSINIHCLQGQVLDNGFIQAGEKATGSLGGRMNHESFNAMSFAVILPGKTIFQRKEHRQESRHIAHIDVSRLLKITGRITGSQRRVGIRRQVSQVVRRRDEIGRVFRTISAAEVSISDNRRFGRCP